MKEQHTSVKYTRSEIETLPDETDWERVDVLTDEDIEEAASSDPDDPPTDASFWKDATVVMPENKVGKEQPMPQINIDSDLLVAQRLPDGSGSHGHWLLGSVTCLTWLRIYSESVITVTPSSEYSLRPITPKFGILENIVSISLSNLARVLLQTCRRRAIKWLMKQSIYLHRVVDGTPTILKRELLATLLLTT